MAVSNLITQTIKNLKGGISQQPDILRFPDQGKAQINGFSSEVEGLQKRPPSKHIKRLRAQLPNNALIRPINRDASERYYVSFANNSLEVFDLAGNQKTVAFPTGASYLATATPRDDIRMVTIADYTFIVNRRVKVEAENSLSYPDWRTSQHALINIKGGQYGRTYRITLNGGLVATYTTPNGTTAADAPLIDTDAIRDQLATQLVAALPTWTIEKGPSYIHIKTTDADAISSLTTSDGFNNGLLTGVIGTAQRFNMLPAQAPDGYMVKVTGDPGSGSDDYYIRYNASGVVWEEVIAPGVKYSLTASSMPHILVRQADGTFTFQRATWQNRVAGDDDSSPMPSFVDAYINDVFFFRNRLGLLSGENIILSGTGEYFKFFPPSVVAVADTDTIDVAVSHSRVSTLNHAVAFAEELLLWSDQTQFVMRAEGTLSIKTVRVDVSTEFESSIKARPVAAGRGVYFAAPRAQYTSIRRYYIVADTSSVKNAEDISAHVPSYVNNGVHSLGSSTSENIVSVLTDGAPSNLFLYKYLYLDEQLAQQSWSHWEFGTDNTILAAEMIGSTMYIVRNSPSGAYLESIEFTQNTKDFTDEPMRLYMDRKVRLTSGITYNMDDNTSKVSLTAIYGGQPSGGDFWWVNGTTGRCEYFKMPTGGWVDGGWITVRGDWRALSFVGRAFNFQYDFSKFYIKVQDQMGTRSEVVGRQQMRRAWVDYSQSGAFDVIVNESYRYTMSGKRLGTYVLGEGTVDTGQFRYPLATNVENCRVSIQSNSPTPLALIGAGWEAAYMRRAKSV